MRISEQESLFVALLYQAVAGTRVFELRSRPSAQPRMRSPPLWPRPGLFNQCNQLLSKYLPHARRYLCVLQTRPLTRAPPVAGRVDVAHAARSCASRRRARPCLTNPRCSKSVASRPRARTVGSAADSARDVLSSRLLAASMLFSSHLRASCGWPRPCSTIPCTRHAHSSTVLSARGSEQSVAPLGKSICLIQFSAHPQHESEAVQKQTAQRMQRRIVEQRERALIGDALLLLSSPRRPLPLQRLAGSQA